jgi:transposase-like protein
MLGELVRGVLERALEAELTAHLGYEQDACSMPADTAAIAFFTAKGVADN